MKKILTVLSVAVFISLGAYAKDIRIAVVDVGKVMTQSELGKKIKKEMEDKISYYKKQIDKLQKKYEEIDKQLQNPVLSEEGKKKKEKEKQDIQDKLRNIQMQAAEELNRMKMEAEKKLSEKIEKVVKAYAKKHNIDLVLAKTPLTGIIYSSEKIDITDSILKEMNKK